MAYLVVKRGGFWRRSGSLRLRRVNTWSFLFWRGVSREETYVKKGRVLVVVGGAGSGKSRELGKLYGFSRELYGVDGVFISVGEALTNWYRRAGLSAEVLRGLSQFEKNKLLIEVCKGKAVFLDDVDRADSKVKVDLVKWLVRVAKVVVVSCKDLKGVNAGIVQELRNKLRLKAHQGFDDRLVVDLGQKEAEVKDVGLIVGIVLVVFVAMAWGLSQALLGALAFRWLVAEGRK